MPRYHKTTTDYAKTTYASLFFRIVALLESCYLCSRDIKSTTMDAKKDYSHVISGYRNELRLNGKATLSAYCRSVGVSISAVHHWMENYGITTKKIEGSDYPFIVRIACIQHIKRRFIDFARRNIRDAYDDTSYSRKMD